jgi:hypothetical protein
VAQLDELQPAQELPPATDEVMPLSSVEKQQIVESARSAFFPHSGQSVASSALLNGRSTSNFLLHPVQTYSYIGILFLRFQV